MKQVFILTSAYLLFYYIFSTYRKWHFYRNQKNSSANARGTSTKYHSNDQENRTQTSSFSDVSDGEFKEL